jgi:hypothetical protein
MDGGETVVAERLLGAQSAREQQEDEKDRSRHERPPEMVGC